MITYSLDTSYFKNIDTSDKAFWLGFICADGSVKEIRGVPYLKITQFSTLEDNFLLIHHFVDFMETWLEKRTWECEKCVMCFILISCFYNTVSVCLFFSYFVWDGHIEIVIMSIYTPYIIVNHSVCNALKGTYKKL